MNRMWNRCFLLALPCLFALGGEYALGILSLVFIVAGALFARLYRNGLSARIATMVVSVYVCVLTSAAACYIQGLMTGSGLGGMVVYAALFGFFIGALFETLAMPPSTDT